MSLMSADWKTKYSFHKIRTIVLTPDNNYIKYVSATILSLIHNKSDNEVLDIIILTSSINKQNELKLLSMQSDDTKIRVYFADCLLNHYIPNVKLSSTGYWSTATFYRLLIPLIMSDYEKVLYIDSDIICANKIYDFFEIPFDTSSLIAVIDSAAPDFDKNRAKRFLESFHLNKFNFNQYFNAGVTYFNINKIDKRDYNCAVINLLSKKYEFQDQDILNFIFRNSTKIVHQRYNFQAGMLNWGGWIEQIKKYGSYEQEWEEALETPVFIHFVGKEKPWNHKECWFSEKFWTFAKESPFFFDILQSSLFEIRAKESVQLSDILLIKDRRLILFKYHLYKLLSVFNKNFGFKEKLYAAKRKHLKDIGVL